MRDASRTHVEGGIGRGRGRSAGALNAVGDWKLFGRGYAEGDGHTIGSTRPPPGFDGYWPAGMQLTCKSCHSVHGNGKYRSLAIDPLVASFPSDDLPLAASGDPLTAPGADVYFAPAGQGTRGSGESTPVLAARDRRNAMNAFCAACHPRLHGDANTRTRSIPPPDGRGSYVRHPTTGVPVGPQVRRAIERMPEKIRLSWYADGQPELSCLTCHRAHGSRNPFGLVFWDATSAANGEDGAGKGPQDLCLACHGEQVAAR